MSETPPIDEIPTSELRQRTPLRQRRRLDLAVAPEGPRPTCSICHAGQLDRVMVRRFDTTTALIGGALAACAAFLLIVVAVALAATVSKFGFRWLEGGGPQLTLAALAVGLLTPCAIGSALAGRMRVLQCSSCGATVAAS